MNKKNYIAPEVTVVNVDVQCALMSTGSMVGVSNQVYDVSSNGAIRSREGSLWDDDME
jgi:hypothetical protein